jgi:hypothetical protein
MSQAIEFWSHSKIKEHLELALDDALTYTQRSALILGRT